MTEVSEQLEGLYGLLPDGSFHSATDYLILSSNKEAAVTRQQLETLLADEMEAEIQPLQAREKLVNEVAFTWLNRVVALKMMESRKLIKQSVSKGSDSNGFKLWLTERGNESHYSDYEAGDLPQDGLGEGPRQRAYRQYILSLCKDLSEEIRVLFELDNIPSRLFPRPNVLNDLLKFLNEESLAGAWLPGNEETIGWIYQFFVEEQKKDVFYRLYTKKEKIRAEDIPAATQIFTPRWIVKCLVQNTLGRLWLEIHPDSRLQHKLDYLLPFQKEQSLHLPSLVKDIKVLDPACGTMHFGLVAFDLLAEMYTEEFERRGDSGWMDTASVNSKEEIPAQIIASNIHGIDIDLRAVQLSALTLFMRAKSLEPKTKLSECHLACADINMLAGEQLDRFFETADLEEKNIYAKATALLSALVKNSNQLGSLLRIADEIKQIVEAERKRSGANTQQLTLPLRGTGRDIVDISFWDQLELQLVKSLHAAASLTNDKNRSQVFFAREAQKGLRFLEITGQQYDVVLANPPYLAATNMNPLLKGYLSKPKNYAISKGDLYAAFIHRCTEWVKEHGRLGMITQQSFMFTSSYNKLRHFLRERLRIELVPHVGPRAFDEVPGQKVNTTLLVLRRDSNKTSREQTTGTFIRLVNEQDAESKKARFELALANLRQEKTDPAVYRRKQSEFDEIPGSPWVYWTSEFEQKMFEQYPNLASQFDIDMGLKTSGNVRFVRWWWEIGLSQIALPKDRQEAAESGNKWFLYAKGGRNLAFSSSVDHVVNWACDGVELKAHLTERYPYLNGKTEWCTHNESLYFKPGLSWFPVSSAGFRCRKIPPGVIASNASYGIFVNADQAPTLLAFLNSVIGRYLASSH